LESSAEGRRLKADGFTARVFVTTLSLALGWASAASAQARMWVVRDADSTIYMMGTVHLLRPGLNWRSAKLDAALKEATELWLETPDVGVSTARDQQIQQMLITAGLSSGATISERLTPEERSLWVKATESVSTLVPVQILERLRPWAASMLLEAANIVQAGYDPTLGVEEVLGKAALDQGDTIRGFETSEEQIRQLSTLPETVALDALRQTLQDFASGGRARFDRAVEGWARGDITLMEQEMAETHAAAPELFDAEVVQRNQNWANQIERLLKGSGVTFIAVGAGHMLGADSVQMKLKAKGIEVTEY